MVCTKDISSDAAIYYKKGNSYRLLEILYIGDNKHKYRFICELGTTDVVSQVELRNCFAI